MSAIVQFEKKPSDTYTYSIFEYNKYHEIFNSLQRDKLYGTIYQKSAAKQYPLVVGIHEQNAIKDIDFSNLYSKS